MMDKPTRVTLARVLLTFILGTGCVALASFGNPLIALAIFVLGSVGMKGVRS